MSEIKVDKISPQSGTALQIGDSSDVITIPAGATITNSGTATGFGGGKVLQVINAIVSAAYARTNVTATWESTGLTASITATATTSKILVLSNIYAAPRAGSSNTHYNNVSIGLFRDSTQIGGSRQVPLMNSNPHTTECGIVWYDTTSIADTTTAIVYTIKNNDADGGAGRFSMNDTGESIQQVATSSIVLMEIGA